MQPSPPLLMLCSVSHQSACYCLFLPFLPYIISLSLNTCKPMNLFKSCHWNVMWALFFKVVSYLAPRIFLMALIISCQLKVLSTRCFIWLNIYITSPLSFTSVPLLCPHWAFLASLILASKFMQDKCYSNQAWAKLSGLPPWEIGRCSEFSFMRMRFVQYGVSVWLMWSIVTAARSIYGHRPPCHVCFRWMQLHSLIPSALGGGPHGAG